MVYHGPSVGCERCRKAKKSCGLEQPACARCVRMKKPCTGYRDSVQQFEIRDESQAVGDSQGEEGKGIASIELLDGVNLGWYGLAGV